MTTPNLHPSRRAALALSAGAAASALLPRAGAAQATDLTVFGHRVHQAAATAGPGGDATEAFRKQSGSNLSWVTLGDNNAIHERLLREATLSATSLDVAYLLNGRAVPKNLKLFEPLDAFQGEAPVEDFSDIAPGLLARLRVEGALHGIPVRHATNVIVYNEALFAERGVAIPKTFEEMAEAARTLTFKRDDGSQVYGLAFTPVFASNFLTIARCLDGDYMTTDRKVVAAEPGMVKALGILADLYKAGALPRNLATPQQRGDRDLDPAGTGGHEHPALRPARLLQRSPEIALPWADRALRAADVRRARRQGRLCADRRVLVARHPSQCPEQANLVGFRSRALLQGGDHRDGAQRQWAGAHLDLCRPEVPRTVPYAAEEAKAVAASRIHLPAFDEQSRAHDIFVEESQAAVLGMKTPAQAMTDATKRVQPLVGA